MDTRDLQTVRNILNDYLTESELAVVLLLLENDTIELYDVFNVDTIEELSTLDDIQFVLKINTLEDLDIMEGTFAKYIEVKTIYGNRYYYIVTDSLDEANVCASNAIKEYAEQNGFEDFDIDITEYVELDFFKEWNTTQLETTALEMYNTPSDVFQNELIEYLFEEDQLDDSSFSNNKVTGEINYKKCLVDKDLLIDDYVRYNEVDNRSLINNYIQSEGIDAFETALNNNDIEVDWDKLSQDCIDQDGVERYLSIDNTLNDVDIGDTILYVFLENQTNY